MEPVKLFGTDGIRGVAGRYPLDARTVKAIGAAAARVLGKEGNRRPLVIIGRDTRESGPFIGRHLKSELAKAGVEVWDLGVIPTPCVAYTVQQHPVLAGIVISASHNPYQDNGIKFFSPRGIKLPDALEAEIERHIHALAAEEAQKRAANGKAAVRRTTAPVKVYARYLKSTFPSTCDLAGMRIVIDCANGATFEVAQRLFSSLGADVVAINAAPDGRNINEGCGALHPEKMVPEVLRHKAACGLAFDGDGDRIIFVDETGQVRDGDYLLSIAATFLKSCGTLANNTLVTTVMANFGLFKAMEKAGIQVLKTPVGDRYVFEEMVRTGAVLGGEQSGHIIFKEFLSTGDGMLSALQILGIMRRTGRPLSALAGVLEKYPQVLLNTKVSRKVPIERLPETFKVIKDAQGRLRDDGRILVRYSGTENLLRVMVEGPDGKQIADMAREITGVAVKEIERQGVQ